MEIRQEVEDTQSITQICARDLFLHLRLLNLKLAPDVIEANILIRFNLILAATRFDRGTYILTGSDSDLILYTEQK